jgi:hypothetical protein
MVGSPNWHSKCQFSEKIRTLTEQVQTRITQRHQRHQRRVLIVCDVDYCAAKIEISGYWEWVWGTSYIDGVFEISGACSSRSTIEPVT